MKIYSFLLILSIVSLMFSACTRDKTINPNLLSFEGDYKLTYHVIQRGPIVEYDDQGDIIGVYDIEEETLVDSSFMITFNADMDSLYIEKLIDHYGVPRRIFRIEAQLNKDTLHYYTSTNNYFENRTQDVKLWFENEELHLFYRNTFYDKLNGNSPIYPGSYVRATAIGRRK